MIYDEKAMQQARLCYLDPDYIPSHPLVYGYKVMLDDQRVRQNRQPKSEGGLGGLVILAIILIALFGGK